MRTFDAQAAAESALVRRLNPLHVPTAGDAGRNRQEIEGVLRRTQNRDLLLRMQYPLHLSYLLRSDMVALLNAAGANVQGVPAYGSIRRSFTDEQLALSTAPVFREPTLVLVPNVSFSSLLHLIRRHEVYDQDDTIVEFFPSEKRELDGTWQPCIVDAANGPSVRRNALAGTSEHLDAYIQRQMEQEGEVHAPIDRHIYAALMLLSMSHHSNVRELMDYRSSTVLLGEWTEQMKQDERVPIGTVSQERKAVRFATYDVMGRGETFGSGAHWLRPAVIGQYCR